MPISENDPGGSVAADGAGVVGGDPPANRNQPAPGASVADRNANIDRLTARARTLRNQLRYMRGSAAHDGKVIRARFAMSQELAAVNQQLFDLMQLPLFPGAKSGN